MSKRTRYFVLAAVAFLVVGLTTGLVASYMGLSVSLFSRAAGPEELQFVPADAAVVAYANVRQVMNSDFRQRFRKLEPESREKDEFQQKTGINIEQDIEQVVAAVMPAAEGAEWSPEGGVVVVARGRFDQSRLEALALEHGAKVEEYSGTRLLAHTERAEARHAMAVAFLDAELVALGSTGAVKRAIDAKSGGANVASNAELMRQIHDVESNSAWAVGHFEALARQARLPNEIRSQVPSIQWFSAAGQINGGVSGVFKAEARDEEAATNLRDVLRGFLALAKMQAGARPELKTMVDSLQLAGDGKTVSVAFTVPTEVFDALEALTQKRHADEPK